jgi:hypothetical protein
MLLELIILCFWLSIDSFKVPKRLNYVGDNSGLETHGCQLLEQLIFLQDTDIELALPSSVAAICYPSDMLSGLHRNALHSGIWHYYYP